MVAACAKSLREAARLTHGRMSGGNGRQMDHSACRLIGRHVWHGPLGMKGNGGHGHSSMGRYEGMSGMGEHFPV